MGLFDDSEPLLRQKLPKVYGLLGGLLGTAPDEMQSYGSILDPQVAERTAAVRSGASVGFPVGTALGVAPAVGLLGKFVGSAGGYPSLVKQSGALYPDGLQKAKAILESIQAGEKPKAAAIAKLSDEQFSGLNQSRSSIGQPPFQTPEVIYNGTHQYGSRAVRDGDSIDEILSQIAGGLSDDAKVVMHPRGPALQNPSPRVNARGETVNDRAVLEGGGERPTWLFSTYGKKK